jgi:hypothetical protein
MRGLAEAMTSKVTGESLTAILQQEQRYKERYKTNIESNRLLFSLIRLSHLVPHITVQFLLSMGGLSILQTNHLTFRTLSVTDYR